LSRLDGSERGRRRIGIGIALLVGVVGVLAWGRAPEAAADEVRVLLYEAPEPIRIEPVDGPGPVVKLALDADGGLLATRDSQTEWLGHAGVWAPRGAGPWRISGRNGVSRSVRGRLEVWSDEGVIQVLNRVDLEDYVGSTVGGEMISSWPIEALRAQAVAARTYVLHEAGKRNESAWDVRATELSQVYRGLSAETPRTVSATRSTEGEILVHDGEPILAVFHSTAGGHTAGSGEVWGRDLPYLRAIEVEGEDDAPYTFWRSPKRRSDVEMHARSMGFGVGTLHGIEIASRTPSGRVERLELAGSRGQVSLSGVSLRQFAATLGLRSTLFEVDATDAGFAFVGSGYGHGVGMSQWGARAMAIRGASYRQILETFYPGAALHTGETSLSEAPLSPPVGSGASASRRAVAGRRFGTHSGFAAADAHSRGDR
jgi:stage II sporulation protein D